MHTLTEAHFASAGLRTARLGDPTTSMLAPNIRRDARSACWAARPQTMQRRSISPACLYWEELHVVAAAPALLGRPRARRLGALLRGRRALLLVQLAQPGGKTAERQAPTSRLGSRPSPQPALRLLHAVVFGEHVGQARRAVPAKRLLVFGETAAWEGTFDQRRSVAPTRPCAPPSRRKVEHCSLPGIVCLGDLPPREPAFCCAFAASPACSPQERRQTATIRRLAWMHFKRVYATRAAAAPRSQGGGRQGAVGGAPRRPFGAADPPSATAANPLQGPPPHGSPRGAARRPCRRGLSLPPVAVVVSCRSLRRRRAAAPTTLRFPSRSRLTRDTDGGLRVTLDPAADELTPPNAEEHEVRQAGAERRRRRRRRRERRCSAASSSLNRSSSTALSMSRSPTAHHDGALAALHAAIRLADLRLSGVAAAAQRRHQSRRAARRRCATARCDAIGGIVRFLRRAPTPLCRR